MSKCSLTLLGSSNRGPRVSACRGRLLLLLPLFLAILLSACAGNPRFYAHSGGVVVDQGESLTINLFHTGGDLRVTDPGRVRLLGDGVEGLEVTWVKDCPPLEEDSPRYLQLRVKFPLQNGDRATITSLQIAGQAPLAIGAIEVYGADVPHLISARATTIKTCSDRQQSDDISIRTTVAGGCDALVSLLPALPAGSSVSWTDVSANQDGSLWRLAFNFPAELWDDQTCVIWRPAVTALYDDEETLVPGPLLHFFLNGQPAG